MGNTTNKGNAIYPAWRQALRDIFKDPYKYTTIILTGCIGSGKSTIGVFIALYMLYCLMCIKDPHSYFGIEATQNNIMFIFNNLTLPKAQKGMLGTFIGHTLKSPWFRTRGIFTGEQNKMYIPNKRIRFDIASEERHITSTDCFCFCFDEANDVIHNDGNYQDSQAMKILNAANQRIRSRFRAKDRSMFFGKSIVISSKQSEMAFLEQYTRDLLEKDPDSVYIFDKPQWEVIPIQLSGKTFNIAYGNKNAKSRIMSDTEDISTVKEQGYQILNVPVEYKKDFEDNLNRALTEVAGVSISYIDKFFSREYVSKAIDKTIVNPFSSDVLVVGLRDNHEYKDFFNPDLISQEWLKENIYMHFDTSFAKDKTGISAVSQSRTNPEEIHHIFTVGIEAPKNDQICFKKHEDFVFYLYDKLGWNIKNISSDGFNSTQLKQNFILHGIDADYISPDRTATPYISLQRLLYDKLLRMIDIPLLEKELVELNYDNYKQKCDHPITGCFTADTKISLVDGRELTILELLDEYNNGKINYVYSINEKTYKIEPKPILKVFKTKEVNKILKITLDNNEVIQCTPEHLFMNKNGEYYHAIDLISGNKLMSRKKERSFKHSKLSEIPSTPVYDLTIKDNPNFALSSGIFVHNSKDLSDSLACAVQNAINHRSTESIVSDMFSEGDLLHAFVNNTTAAQTIYNPQSIAAQTNSMPNIQNQVKYDIFGNPVNNTKNEETDIEYFRF